MLYTNRTWYPVRDAAGIVHHATSLTKKEVEYLFSLADTVRAAVGCGQCSAAQGEFCRSNKEGSFLRNHSYRVRQARLLFEQRILPKPDRLHQTLCSAESGPGWLVYKPADGHDIDCMSCLVVRR